MKDFKELMKETYKDYQVDELRSKKLEAKILDSIEGLEIAETKPTKPIVRWLTAAASIAVIVSTFYMTQYNSLFEYDPVGENLDQIAGELDKNPVLVSQTTMSIGSPDDIYYQNIKEQSKNLNSQEIRKILEEI